jgi:DNA-binding beta-propeller fold protein YncE
MRRLLLLPAAVAAAGLAAPAGAPAAGHAAAVFTETNAAGGNRVVIFARAADGHLTRAGSVATGGRGSGAGLGSQGAVALSPDHHRLYAVNAGTASLSVLGVDGAHVWRMQVVGSGGRGPISVAAGRTRVFVLNTGGAGGTPSVAAFSVTGHGLRAVPHGRRALTAADADPAQVGIAAGGRVLLVTNKTSSTIDTIPVHRDGSLGRPESHASAGATPFGFAVTSRGLVIVSDATEPPTSAATAYRVRRGGELATLSGPVDTKNLAACWVAVTPNGRFAYTTNTHSGTVTGLRVGAGGRLSLLDPGDGVTAGFGSAAMPIDEAVARGGRILDVLVITAPGGRNAIMTLRIARNGSLHPVGEAGALPASAGGLASS